MNNNEILKLALDHGFKLKPQPDGSVGLNPYVFEFARALLAAAPTPPVNLDFGLPERVRDTNSLVEHENENISDKAQEILITSNSTELKPAQEDDNSGEDITKFYILRKPGLVPRVCRPMGNDLAANLRDWFKHHPGATIDIVRVRLIDGRVSDLWVDDGIEYLQILDDGGWIPERPDTSARPAQEAEPVAEIVCEDLGRPFNAAQIRTHFYKAVPQVGTKLYTRPANDKLRKAAREFIDYFNPDDDIERSLEQVMEFIQSHEDKLRTALEGK